MHWLNDNGQPKCNSLQNTNQTPKDCKLSAANSQALERYVSDGQHLSDVSKSQENGSRTKYKIYFTADVWPINCFEKINSEYFGPWLVKYVTGICSNEDTSSDWIYCWFFYWIGHSECVYLLSRPLGPPTRTVYVVTHGRNSITYVL